MSNSMYFVVVVFAIMLAGCQNQQAKQNTASIDKTSSTQSEVTNVVTPAPVEEDENAIDNLIAYHQSRIERRSIFIQTAESLLAITADALPNAMEILEPDQYAMFIEEREQAIKALEALYIAHKEDKMMIESYTILKEIDKGLEELTVQLNSITRMSKQTTQGLLDFHNIGEPE